MADDGQLTTDIGHHNVANSHQLDYVIEHVKGGLFPRLKDRFPCGNWHPVTSAYIKCLVALSALDPAALLSVLRVSSQFLPLCRSKIRPSTVFFVLFCSLHIVANKGNVYIGLSYSYRFSLDEAITDNLPR